MIKRLLCVAALCCADCAIGPLADAPTSTICNEIAASVASRSLECNADAGAANSAANLFAQSYSCASDTLSDSALSCATAVARAPCGDVAAGAPSFETLVKRDAPICNNWVTNVSGGTTLTPYGSVQMNGTVNGDVGLYDCTFAATNLTSIGAPENVSQAVAAVDCQGAVQFTLVVSKLQPNVIYTSVTAGESFISDFIFSQNQGTDDGTDSLYSLEFSTARLDPDNYLVAAGQFHRVHQGTTLQYDVQGSFDLVILPPSAP